MTKRNDNARLLIAAALGGLVGAATALLFAPKSGKETRAQLNEKGQQVKQLASSLKSGEMLMRRGGEEAKRGKRARFFASSPRLPSRHRYDYDALIIGGGHNGLVMAAYLAKAGRKVLVLERRAIVGGAAVTEELIPGFKFSSCADGLGGLSPAIVRDLNLQRHGLEYLSADPAIFAPQPDGRALTIWRDVNRATQEIENFSKKDAARYPDFINLIGKVSSLVGALMTVTPPHMPRPAAADIPELLKLLGPARQLSKKDIHDTLRILPMSVADLLDEWFESDAVRGLIAARGISGITWGPRAAGTAYTLLYSCAGDGQPFGSGGIVKGGMGGLTQAIAGAARHYGAEIRTGVEVAEIIVERGQTNGVRLANGQVITAAAIISNADPRTTFMKLVDPAYLDPFFVKQVQNIKYRGSGARVHLALKELPQFTALTPPFASPVNGEGWGGYLRGYTRIAPSLNYLEKAFDAAKYGQFARQPYLDVTIPSLLDPSLAPAGQHVMSIYMQYAPYNLREGAWDDCRETLGQVVIDTLTEYAPNLKKSILHSQVLTPLDLEQIYGLPEGNPHHGEMTLDQFLYMRPVPGYAQYRAPIEGLYLCGAGTHPGGGVTGLPGYNAAREILKDWGIIERDQAGMFTRRVIWPLLSQ
ncbi:MAG: amine oxidase [Anaerolineae bacterium]|nr:FAD-dependent oxidoreductase [Anaerolineales bacterium]MCQ3973345.1 amine oxidase [Anaerolineae bacterium]